jgi:hypothetical protein
VGVDSAVVKLIVLALALAASIKTAAAIRAN